jgi:1-acyl-sn-glycerol-3-phosphate acyltransferase
MKTLRSLVFYSLWGLWTALFGCAIPLLWSVRSPPTLVRTLSRIWARGILALLSGVVGLKYLERGRARVPQIPCLIVVNHQSTWETLAALVLFPDVAIVSKRELLRIPVMGWYLGRSPMIVIDRASTSKALREMTQQSRAAVAGGRSVLIFPEGTRKRAGEPVEFKRGVELLYRTLGVPVLPVVVNSGLFWGIGGAPGKGTITVSFLTPIDPGLTAAKFTSSAEALIGREKNALEREADARGSAAGGHANLTSLFKS